MDEERKQPSLCFGCSSQWRRRRVPRTGGGVEQDGGGPWGARGFLSDRVRGQLQEGGRLPRGQVMEAAHLCGVFDGDVHVVPFPSLATDGTEVRIHQLHDLSQLWQREREKSHWCLALSQKGGER